MATYIDHVRCGQCNAGLTLEASNVVLQRYRRQPWLQHFWVRCDACAADKLYWPTARQIRLAAMLGCRVMVVPVANDEVSRAYGRTNPMPTVSRGSTVDIPRDELGFLLSMLAATSRLTDAASRLPGGPTRSYLPPHWAN